MSVIMPISFGIAFYVAWGIGGNNGTMAPLAGSGLTTVRRAAFLGAIMAFLGAAFLGYRVEKTIGRDLLLYGIDPIDVFIVVFSMATWSIMASYRGWPVSATHSGVGAAIGLGLMKWGKLGVNWVLLTNIALMWFLSPLIGLFGAMIVMRAARHFLRKHTAGLEREMKIARLSAVPLVMWSCVHAFSWGANDIGTATAFLSVIYGNSLLVRIVVGLGMLLGSMVLGKRVTRSVGLKLVRLDPVMALSAEMTVAIIMLFGTLLGLPLSGTHILVGAVIGVGSARGIWINVKGLKQIVATWLATFFIAIIMCVIIFLAIATFLI